MTGGYPYTDTTELLVPGSGSWRLATGLLPRPMWGVRVATVGNTLYLTGGIVILLYCTDVYIQVAIVMGTILTRSWSSALTPRTGAWLATCWRLGGTTLSPPSAVKMSTYIVIITEPFSMNQFI